ESPPRAKIARAGGHLGAGRAFGDDRRNCRPGGGTVSSSVWFERAIDRLSVAGAGGGRWSGRGVRPSNPQGSMVELGIRGASLIFRRRREGNSRDCKA